MNPHIDTEITKRCRSFMKKSQERCAEKKNKAGTVIRVRVPIQFTMEELRLWLVNQQEGAGCWRCAYCQRRLALTEVEIDHDVPLTAGGPAALHNQVISCKLDNQSKGELTGVDYLALLGLLRTMGWGAESYVLTALRMVGMAKRQRFFPRPAKAAPASLSSTYR